MKNPHLAKLGRSQPGAIIQGSSGHLRPEALRETEARQSKWSRVQTELDVKKKSLSADIWHEHYVV